MRAPTKNIQLLICHRQRHDRQLQGMILTFLKFWWRIIHLAVIKERLKSIIFLHLLVHFQHNILLHMIIFFKSRALRNLHICIWPDMVQDAPTFWLDRKYTTVSNKGRKSLKSQDQKLLEVYNIYMWQQDVNWWISRQSMIWSLNHKQRSKQTHQKWTVTKSFFFWRPKTYGLSAACCLFRTGRHKTQKYVGR